jgi:hypothetical protein
MERFYIAGVYGSNPFLHRLRQQVPITRHFTELNAKLLLLIL